MPSRLTRRGRLCFSQKGLIRNLRQMPTRRLPQLPVTPPPAATSHVFHALDHFGLLSVRPPVAEMPGPDFPQQMRKAKANCSMNRGVFDELALSDSSTEASRGAPCNAAWARHTPNWHCLHCGPTLSSTRILVKVRQRYLMMRPSYSPLYSVPQEDFGQAPARHSESRSHQGVPSTSYGSSSPVVPCLRRTETLLIQAAPELGQLRLLVHAGDHLVVDVLLDELGHATDGDAQQVVEDEDPAGRGGAGVEDCLSAASYAAPGPVSVENVG